MLLPKALKMRAIKDTMALVADSIGGTKCAPAQMSRHLRHLNPALLNWQGMSTHPKTANGSELCHWKGQLIVGLCVDPVRPCKPPQIGAKLGTPRGSNTRRNVKRPQTDMGDFPVLNMGWLDKKKMEFQSLASIQGPEGYGPSTLPTAPL